MSTPVTVRWRWTLNGAVIGVAIVLFDLILEWRGPTYLPWSGDGITGNIIQMLTVVMLCAFIGLAAGYVRDIKKLRSV